MKQDPLDPRLLFVDPKIGGGLIALRIANGEKIWFSPPIVCAPTAKPGCSPAQSQAVTAIPGVVFSGSLDGHLCAYSAGEGKIVWDFDTVCNYQTVNGVRPTGGSLNGPCWGSGGRDVIREFRIRAPGQHTGQRSSGILSGWKIRRHDATAFGHHITEFGIRLRSSC